MKSFIPLLLLSFFLSSLHGQCDLTEIVEICDMTVIDGNGDGVPDGIINLFDVYFDNTGNTISGNFWLDPGFNFALETDASGVASSGNLFLWDLNESTVSNALPSDYYEFQLFKSSCGSTPALTILLQLAPYSGEAVPATGINDVNVQVCADEERTTFGDSCPRVSSYDLDLILLSLPSAHQNGRWSYIGSSPNFLGISGSIFSAVIPYQPGPPLVDEEIFEVVYTVPGVSPCDSSVETRAKISVVRQVFAGFGNEFNICEDDIESGMFDNIDLRDDNYLVNEDIEGIAKSL